MLKYPNLDERGEGVLGDGDEVETEGVGNGPGTINWDRPEEKRRVVRRCNDDKSRNTVCLHNERADFGTNREG